MASRFDLSSRFGGLVALQRVRLRCGRAGVAARLSHLQQIDVLRRSLEASGWPVARTQARHAKIKASFGPAISVGYESDCEYVDVDLSARMDLAKALAALSPHLPEGFTAQALKSIPRFFPSLEETLNAARYAISSALLRGTEEKWRAFDQKAQFIVIKKKQDKDVAIDAKPCVHSWALEEDRLSLLVRFGPGRTLKPERIIQAICGFADTDVAMGTPDCKFVIRRTHLYMENANGEMIQP